MKHEPAALIACFASEDLNRWRLLVGAEVVHRDSRWGAGRIVDVAWQARDDGLVPRGSVFLRIEYRNGLRARLNTRSLAEYLTSVAVTDDVAALLAACYGPEGPIDDPVCVRRLADFDRELRERLDAERLERAAELRRRSRARRRSERI
jgi:hypothetical protein